MGFPAEFPANFDRASSSTSFARNNLPLQGSHSFLGQYQSWDQGLVLPASNINIVPPLSTNLTPGVLRSVTIWSSAFCSLSVSTELGMQGTNTTVSTHFTWVCPLLPPLSFLHWLLSSDFLWSTSVPQFLPGNPVLVHLLADLSPEYPVPDSTLFPAGGCLQSHLHPQSLDYHLLFLYRAEPILGAGIGPARIKY